MNGTQGAVSPAAQQDGLNGSSSAADVLKKRKKEALKPIITTENPRVAPG